MLTEDGRTQTVYNLNKLNIQKQVKFSVDHQIIEQVPLVS